MASGADGGEGGGKTFLLGVGAQKGGTSWLHDYLSRSEQADLGAFKEYHIFDALDLGGGAGEADADAAAEEADAGTDRPGLSRSGLRRVLRADTMRYYDYFAGLLAPPGIALTGDITPAYSALSVERFGAIRAGFAARGIPVKAVFLMRDPVERVWSWVRMKVQGKARKGNMRRAEIGEEALLLKTHGQSKARARSDYPATIAALEQAFPPGDILYAFYEQLFTEDMTRRLCGFLGISHVAPDFDHAVNASPKTSDISAEVAARVARAYAEVYRGVAVRFGGELVRALWPHARYVEF